MITRKSVTAGLHFPIENSSDIYNDLQCTAFQSFSKLTLFRNACC